MQISVNTDISQALAKLKDYPTKQLPFAIASALTDTATQVQNLLTNKLPEYFDRPTPYTMRAIGIERATKAKLQARIFIKSDQLKYLTFGIDGGTRFPPKRAIPIPVDQGTNQYGNLPRGKIASLLARKDVFSGVVGGIAGIWQRKAGDKLVLLISWKPKASYKARYPFYALGSSTVRAAFPAAFRKALANAAATAR